MDVLLDTNGYSAMMGGNESVVIALGRADQVYMSVIVLGELLYGFRAGNRFRQNSELLEDFLARDSVKILPATGETADVFSRIKADLRKRGKPIPINDVWIAAHALQTGAVVITFDEHFQKIPGIRLWND